MKILTEKRILQIERELMTKMYRAVEKTCEKHGIEKNKDEILDIVLNSFHTPYSGELVYGWHNIGDFSGFLPE